MSISLKKIYLFTIRGTLKQKEVWLMFSLQLKKLRMNKGLSQRELASIFKVSTGTVGNWEVGTREPDYATLIKLANFFNVSVDYLLETSCEEQQKKPDTLSAEERRLLDGYREINAAGKKLVMQTVETLRNTAAGSGSGSAQNKIG